MVRVVTKETPLQGLLEPLRIFSRNKLAGAAFLIASALVALLWANSAAGPSYFAWLQTPVALGFGSFSLSKPLLLWINDGLMAVFFFHVGLEIKREVLIGELASWRKAMLPAVAAVGGMLIPAIVYLMITRGTPYADGWAIPMATDIAFALGVLALLGRRVPLQLKVFLTALAIVDDIGAVIVIALFHTDELTLLTLGVGLGLYALAALLNLARVRSILVYFLVGTLVWFAFLKSGVHATIAALLMAFVIPARSRIDGTELLTKLQGHTERLRSVGIPSTQVPNRPEQQAALEDMAETVHAAGSPLIRLEHALVPLVSLLVLPLFALGNAGVRLEGDLGSALSHPLTLGVLLGLFIGKQVGVFGFAWLAVKSGIADLPSGVTWRQVHAVSMLSGIGFTMALFIGGLAFPDGVQYDLAKVGVLSGSLLCAFVGVAALLNATQRTKPTPTTREPTATSTLLPG